MGVWRCGRVAVLAAAACVVGGAVCCGSEAWGCRRVGVRFRWCGGGCGWGRYAGMLLAQVEWPVGSVQLVVASGVGVGEGGCGWRGCWGGLLGCVVWGGCDGSVVCAGQVKSLAAMGGALGAWLACCGPDDIGGVAVSAVEEHWGFEGVWGPGWSGGSVALSVRQVLFACLCAGAVGVPGDGAAADCPAGPDVIGQDLVEGFDCSCPRA